MKAEQIRKVHCLFEQSGTFKNEFIKLGIPAEDYDIQNNFNQTDHVIDLFAEIDRAYDNLTRQDKTRQDTIFDFINPSQDLIIAFYPCIYFCATSQMNMFMSAVNYRCLDDCQTIQKILERVENRKIFYERLIKFVYVCIAKKIKMVFENPWSEQTYLKANFLKVPDVVDMNRMQRGDYFKKPTAYWFWNFKPTSGTSYQNDKKQKIIMNTGRGKQAGICSEERSMISPDYARNFICDFILGKQQKCIAQQQFEFD
jgi:hypothetical protein